LPLTHALSHLISGSPILRVLARILRDNGRAYLPRYLVAFLFIFVFAGATALSAFMMRDVINKIFVDRDPAALADPRNLRGEGCGLLPPGGLPHPGRQPLRRRTQKRMVDLLQRFWLPDRGAILIDGQPIDGLSLSSLRGQTALVSQDVFLFERTIRDNTRAGRVDATDEQVAAAARSAHIDQFIRSLPKGYDTHVGELGSQVSGGSASASPWHGRS
jgi:ABC-type multidrug transport system fused ATPase/permease subunit